MMWIKVCGIRDRQTALCVAELGIDAIGLNFYAASPRRIEVAEAVEIAKVMPAKVARIGVFVNHSIAEIQAIATDCQLGILQLHGDEPPSFFAELHRRLPRIQLIRAWRMGPEGLLELKNFLDECQSQKTDLAACLIDARVAAQSIAA